MKKIMGLALSAMLISGCAALPESENVGTRGLLLCEANENHEPN
jgi:PBP1b-binding outer membrane lipoprotein LpoB